MQQLALRREIVDTGKRNPRREGTFPPCHWPDEIGGGRSHVGPENRYRERMFFEMSQQGGMREKLTRN
jgi:hypothetical protein